MPWDLLPAGFACAEAALCQMLYYTQKFMRMMVSVLLDAALLSEALEPWVMRVEVFC